MKYTTANPPVHLPQHDPELSQIIEETIELQQHVTAQSRATEEKLQEKAFAFTHSEQENIAEVPLPSDSSTPTPEQVQTPSSQTQTPDTPSPMPVVQPQVAPAPSVISLQGKVPTHEEILAKNTNYIFVFGYTGSGKSTALTAINMYMRQHYRVILNQAENQDGIRLMHQMMRDIEEGYFPQPTSMGQITEYDTAFLMNGTDVNLTFLEMAGEDLKRVDVDTGEEGFSDAIKAYLTCPGITISFLIVADFDRVVARKEDKLILQFLSYLYNEGIDMSRVGVVLSKFDRGRTDMNVEEVIQNYLPQVDKWLTSGDISQPRVFPFSIGEILSEDHKKDEISEIQLLDCDPIVNWLHTTLSLPGLQQATVADHSQPKKGFIGKMRGLLNF
ncbi:MAG: hypothetical protein AAFW00_08970 [Bacteroidota bacterium]